MKKINELKAERAELIEKMEEIEKAEKLTEEQRSEWTGIDNQIKEIDKDIKMAERQEELNKYKVSKMETTQLSEEKSLGVRFRDFIQSAVEKGQQATFRVEPMMSTSNTDILNKTVKPVDLLLSPAEAYLRGLGITFYTGLNGQLVLPNMEQETAGFVAEAVCNGDASMNIADIILAPRRITNSQSVTREFLAQTNPDIYQSLLDNLVAGIYNAVTADVFDTLEVDAATQISVTGASVTCQNILNMEASVGCYALGNMSYVTTPTGKAFLKGLDCGDDHIKYVWDGNTMNGYPASATCAANANRIYFGDWSRQVVAQWGGIEVIVDPYTLATCGKIKVTTLGLFDTGCQNPRAFAILDASLA